MPYQVEAGSLLVVVATDREAIEMFDRLVEDGGQKAIVRDMRGVELDVNRLRALVEGRNDGRVRTP
jgi:hypothetical protein